MPRIELRRNIVVTCCAQRNVVSFFPEDRCVSFVRHQVVNNCRLYAARVALIIYSNKLFAVVSPPVVPAIESLLSISCGVVLSVSGIA